MKKLIEIAELQIKKLEQLQNDTCYQEDIILLSQQINLWVNTIMECKKNENININIRENQLKINEISNKLCNNLNKLLPNQSTI